MPSPESRGGEPNKEPEASPAYYRAARYEDEQSAGEAYFQAQDALLESGYALSTYRMQLDQLWHVAVLGDTPPEAFDQILQAILSTGESVALPPDILVFLNQRRMQARGLGSWVEGHYRPGKPLGK